MDLVNESPRVLGNRYEVGDLLGRGGMAEVHLGRDARLGRTVAIKLLRSDLARDPTFQARFRREAQSAAALNHPAIVAVYDTGEETVTEAGGAIVSLPYIVMEHIEGRTLREVLGEGRTLDVDLALEVTTGVLNALEYSHRIGIVHRDIKPANVMLTPNGDVKVMDFGIARAMADVSSTMTQTQAVIGTAQYLSPEQARGEQVDTRSDLYSTGCLLFELLTGRPPFVADSPVAVAYQHVGEPAPAPSQYAPGIPESVDRIVLHALVKEREARYQTAAEFRADVEAARGGRQVAAPVPVSAEATTQYLGAAGGPATGTRALAPVGAGLLGTEPGPVGPTTAYDDRYGGYASHGGPEERRNRKAPWIIAAVVVAVLALSGAIAAKLMGDGDPPDTQPTQVAVADVVGKDQGIAKRQLQDQGLQTKLTPREVEEDNQVGKVLQQDPAAGAQVAPNSTVTLVVGAEPGTAEVPDVVGDSQDEARQAIQAAKLQVGTVTEEDTTDPRIDPGDVIRTDPRAGEEVKRGTEVALWIASDDVEVPDLTGKTRDEARDTLIDLGLRFRVDSRPSNEARPGTVIDQNPSGGTRVTRNSEVLVIIAEEPPEEPTPTRTPDDEPTGEDTPDPSSSASPPADTP